MGDPEKRVVFLGNSGVGKSALYNSLLQQIIFFAGVSWVTSKKTEVERYKHFNGIVYCDTPGFTNATDVAAAFYEITRVLKTGESYALLFVCVLQAGRPSSSDLVMMRMVLDAINDSRFPYSVIFNKVSKKEMELASRDDHKQQLMELLSHGSRQPEGIFFYPFDRRLHDADNVLAERNVDFENFVSSRSFRTIRPTQVTDCVL